MVKCFGAQGKRQLTYIGRVECGVGGGGLAGRNKGLDEVDERLVLNVSREPQSTHLHVRRNS